MQSEAGNSVESQAGIDTSARYLEALDVAGWYQLLNVLAVGGPWGAELQRAFPAAPGFDVVDEFVLTLGRVSARAVMAYEKAASLLFRDLRRANEADRWLEIDGLLTLVAMVGAGLTPETLVRTSCDRVIPLQTRALALAAAASLVDGAIPGDVYDILPVGDSPELFNASLLLIARNRPDEAILALGKVEVMSRETCQAIEPALRFAVNEARSRSTNDELTKLLVTARADPKAAVAIDHALDLDEFRSLKERISADTGAVLSFPADEWIRLGMRVRESRELPILNFNYSEDQRRSGRNAPRASGGYIPRLAEEWRKQLRSVGKTSSDAIALKYVDATNHADPVAEMLEFRAVCLEPQYGTGERLQKVELIPIGRVSELAIIGEKKRIESIRHSLGADKSMILDARRAGKIRARPVGDIASLKQVLAHFREHNVKMLAQQGSVTVDQISKDWGGAPPHLIRVNINSSSDVVRSVISGSDAVAVLDIGIAAQLFQQLAAEAAPVQFAMMLVSYTEELQVGYFFPRGSIKFRDNLRAILARALLDRRGGKLRWTKPFRDAMERTLVRLDHPGEVKLPTDQVGDTSAAVKLRRMSR